MKAFCDVTIKSLKSGAVPLPALIEAFAESADGWGKLPQQSEEYRRHVDASAVMIHCKKRGLSRAAVALVRDFQKSDSTLKVVNIVPELVGELSIDQYNQIATAFVRDFRKFARENKVPLKITKTACNIGLQEIVGGKRCRELFERYLNAHPWSFHPSDIQRLDAFICSLYRFVCDLNSDRLARYLVSDLGWESKNALWVRDRIETGLAILAVDRNF